MRTARLLRSIGTLLMLAALVLPIALLLEKASVFVQTVHIPVEPREEQPAIPTLEQARQIIPRNLHQIYQALNDGNPASARGLISDQLLNNIGFLDQICRPYSYRAHYIETIIERPSGQFEVRVRELSKPLDETAYVLLFRPFQGQLVLADLLGSRGDEWLESEKHEAGSIGRQFIYAAAAGKRDVVQRLVSPGLDIAPFFDDSDYGTRVRNVGSIAEGPGLGVEQHFGLKVHVYYMTGRKEFCGDLWTLLVDRIRGEEKIVAWKFDPMVGCYRLGQWPNQNRTEDPNLEAYTLERFGLVTAVAASSKPDTQQLTEGNEERKSPTAKSVEARAVSPSESGAAQRVRVVERVMRPLLMDGEQPTYPPSAEQAGISGTVVLRAEINKNGTVEGVQAISGNPTLAAAAMEAVKGWRYRPYTENGQPVDVETEITVPFVENFTSVHK